MAKQDLGEAMQPAKNLLSNMAMATILILSMAIIVAIYQATRLSKPLLNLVEARPAISAGNFSATIPVKQNDEIGKLALHFSVMRDDIQTRITELDNSNKELQEEVIQRKRIESELRSAATK